MENTFVQTNAKQYRIVLTGGGSGGHIMPLIAVAERLRDRYGADAVELLYIGSRGKIEENTMKESNIPAKFILAGKLRRYFSWRNLTDLFRLPVGFVQSLWHLWRFMPDAVFSKGGYVSVPVVIAAWMYRIPVITQDSDAVPGMATRILGKFAKRVAIAYPSARNYFVPGKAALIGNPVRKEILGGNADEARVRFGLNASRPIVAVLGGSLGARLIDLSIAKVLPKLLLRAQVIHQTGEAHYEETTRMAEELGIKADGSMGYAAQGFFSAEEMKHVLAAADLVVSRAGANAIAEIAAVGKPAILIPLSTAANDEQRMNAYEIARLGGALVLEEGNLGENILTAKIADLLSDTELRTKMSEAIKVFYQPDAADKLADELIRLADGA